jgi:hypothetical protein
MKMMNLACALIAALLSAIGRSVPRLMFVATLACATGMFAAGAQAVTLAHTWVSSTGNDANNCDRPTPCGSFQGAYNKTSAEGEITCVDSGDFAGVIITQSITINCESSIGSNSVSGTLLLVIITGTSVNVTLRGLDLDGLGLSSGFACNSQGGSVIFTGSGTLHLQKMKINHLTGPNCGVQFTPSGTATLDITDCDITDNGGSGLAAGIYVQPSTGITAHVSIDHSRINNNYFGVLLDGTAGGIINGTINDSVVSGNVTNGITLHGASSSIALLVDHTIVMGNNYGLVAGGNAVMRVRNSSVTANSTGLFVKSGPASLLSYSNNSVNGNTTDGAFTGPVGLQ